MWWDLFCRVIDFHGDAGVCWRLAADLAARGERVRLWLDDASDLAWMAPRGAPGVQVVGWNAATPIPEPGDVVVEAFGCDPPPAFVERMRRDRPPVWIDLEYLSAEPYVERSHGLPSPQQAGPGAGLVKWFFFPGFTRATGGLLREPGLLERRAAFDAAAWRRGHGIDPRSGERCVSLFCYDAAPVARLVDALAGTPTLLLAAPGEASERVQAALGPVLARGALRAHPLPWLEQADYDRLLWSCDLNFVRGEDSFVRAQWAGAPFVWQIYAQSDGAHVAKLDAFLARHLAGTAPALADAVRELMHAWNGLAPWPARWPDAAAWRAQVLCWRDALAQQDDLGSQLLGFVGARR
ncbi:MAG TPA: elongation factor P maturation arginine rhamnosyltransferase EarP [Ideonella sp.]|nr:elongation factor P maturation arginine rhamnosyltransferase EarP [Ideonella sp.]